MSLTENAKKYHERMFPGYESVAIKKDPEFIERFDNFAYDEVVNQPGQELPDKTRWMANLECLYCYTVGSLFGTDGGRAYGIGGADTGRH